MELHSRASPPVDLTEIRPRSRNLGKGQSKHPHCTTSKYTRMYIYLRLSTFIYVYIRLYTFVCIYIHTCVCMLCICICKCYAHVFSTFTSLRSFESASSPPKRIAICSSVHCRPGHHGCGSEKTSSAPNSKHHSSGRWRSLGCRRWCHSTWEHRGDPDNRQDLTLEMSYYGAIHAQVHWFYIKPKIL